MLNTFKLRHPQLTTRWSRYRLALVSFGRQGCGIGRVDVMSGVVVCGRVRLRATALGTMVAGTTRRVAVGTTAVVTGAEVSALQTQGNFFRICLF